MEKEIKIPFYKEAEKYLLNYTASSKWNQIKKMKWLTVEVLDVMSGFAKELQSTNQLKVEKTELIAGLENADRYFSRKTYTEDFEIRKDLIKAIEYLKSKKVDNKEIEMPTNKEIKEIFHKEGLDSEDEVGVVVWTAYKLGYKAAFKSINQ